MLRPRFRDIADEWDRAALKSCADCLDTESGRFVLRVVEWVCDDEVERCDPVFWWQVRDFVQRSEAIGIRWLCWIEAKLGDRGLLHAISDFEFSDAHYFLPQVDRREPRGGSESCLSFVMDECGADAMHSVVTGSGFGYLDLDKSTKQITLIGFRDGRLPLDLLATHPVEALRQLKSDADCVFIRIKHMSTDAVVRVEAGLERALAGCFAPCVCP